MVVAMAATAEESCNRGVLLGLKGRDYHLWAVVMVEQK